MHKEQLVQENQKNTRQVSLWKKLRLLKKCSHCRNRRQGFNEIDKFLKVYDVNNISGGHDVMNQLIVESLGSNQLKSLKTKETQQFAVDNFRQIYYSNKVTSKLREIIHYYRFYHCSPTPPNNGKIFSVITNFHQTKKALQYKKIQQIYSTGNKSKSPAKIKSNQRLLKELDKQEETTRQDELALIKQLHGIKTDNQTKRSLKEIDQLFSFPHRKQDAGRNSQFKMKTNSLNKQKLRDKYKSMQDSTMRGKPYTSTCIHQKSKGCKGKKFHSSCDDLKELWRSSTQKQSPLSKKIVEENACSQKDRFKKYVQDLKRRIHSDKLALKNIIPKKTPENTNKPKEIGSLSKSGHFQDKKNTRKRKQGKNSKTLKNFQTSQIFQFDC